MATVEPFSYSVIESCSVIAGDTMECPPGLLLGNLHRHEDGWKFYPTFEALASKRGWPTPQAALKRRVKNYTLEAVRPAENKWVIVVAGYGAFLFEGNEQEAEEMRRHKASWEQAVAQKRRATVEEAAGQDVSMCMNHPLFRRARLDRLNRYWCECDRCRKGDVVNVYMKLNMVTA